MTSSKKSQGKSTKDKAESKSRLDKGKAKAMLDVESEDDDLNTTQQSLDDSALLKNYLDAEEFDYDSLREHDDLELWIIRAPGNVCLLSFLTSTIYPFNLCDKVKAKHLEGLKFSIPSSNTSHLGMMERKHAAYDIWSIRDTNSNQSTTTGGDEILSLGCLVPRKTNNVSKLFSGETFFLILKYKVHRPTYFDACSSQTCFASYRSFCSACHADSALVSKWTLNCSP